MKILYLLNRVPWPLKDGGAIAMHTMLEGLHACNAELTILALNTHKHHVDSAIINSKLSHLGKWDVVDVNTDVTALGALFALITNQSYNALRFYNSRFEKRLIDTLKHGHYDAVICDSIYMGQYIDTIRNYTKATTVIRQHNVEWMIWQLLATNTKNIFKKIYLKLLATQLRRFETKCLRQFDKVVSITPNDSKIFRQMGVSVPIHCCPLGIKFSDRQIVVDTSHVYHLGSMEWLPNIEGVEWFLLNVWPLVTEQKPDAQCYIGGRGMSPEWMQKKIKGITMVGEVPDADAFVSDKSIMIVPLFSGSGIRVKILEGMKQGKAIVSTSTGIQGIECNPGHDLLIADDPTTFAGHIVKLIKDTEFRKQISAAALQTVQKHYEISSISKALISYIQG